MDQDQQRESLQGFDLFWFVITLAGCCIDLPLEGWILFL